MKREDYKDNYDLGYQKGLKAGLEEARVIAIKCKDCISEVIPLDMNKSSEIVDATINVLDKILFIEIKKLGEE